tara:strand:+ start:612 stop:815 length:204 start_codon:yes stop_codon:yes gene_type:complete
MMLNSRELNFIAIEQLLESGFDAEELLTSLVKAMSSYEVNDNLAYIVRMHDIEIPCRKELAECEDRE